MLSRLKPSLKATRTGAEPTKAAKAKGADASPLTPVRLTDRVGIAVGASVWGVGYALSVASKNPALLEHSQFLASTAADTSKQFGTLGPLMTLGGIYNRADIWGARAKTALLAELGDTQAQLDRLRSTYAEHVGEEPVAAKAPEALETGKKKAKPTGKPQSVTSRMGVAAGLSLMGTSYALGWAAKDPALAHNLQYIAQSLHGTSQELGRVGPVIALGGAYHWMDVGGLRAKKALRHALNEAKGEIASLERKLNQHTLGILDWDTQKPSART